LDISQTKKNNKKIKNHKFLSKILYSNLLVLNFKSLHGRRILMLCMIIKESITNFK